MKGNVLVFYHMTGWYFNIIQTFCNGMEQRKQTSEMWSVKNINNFLKVTVMLSEGQLRIKRNADMNAPIHTTLLKLIG